MALVSSSFDTKLKHYYALRDDAAEFTGYSRLTIHTLAKAHIFPLMVDEPSLFTTVAGDVPSLKWLTERGLDVYTEAFKEFCAENFFIAL